MKIRSVALEMKSVGAVMLTFITASILYPSCKQRFYMITVTKYPSHKHITFILNGVQYDK
jgi:hypothetical protein